MRVKRRKSKRVSTRMREGIKKKASSQRRKERKHARKDITWKSKRVKDIGIPSSFPYKGRILMDIEEKRRQKQEDLERRKEERRKQRESMMGEDGGIEISKEQEEEETKQDSMAALMESAQKAATDYQANNDTMDTDTNDDGIEVNDLNESGEFVTGPGEKSRKQFDKAYKEVVDASDVILYVLDARDPQATRSKKLEEAILADPSKRLILVLSKVDLIPDESLRQWLHYLKQSFPTVPVRSTNGVSGAKGFNKSLTRANTAGQLLQALKSYAERSNLGRAITVGVVGFPNVGKSSIINALISRRGRNSNACPVGNEAGVTRTLREVKMDNKLRIVDSPGIVFPEFTGEADKGSKSEQKREFQSQLVLLNAIPEKEVVDPESAVELLLRRLAKDNSMADEFKEYYKLPALPMISFENFTKQVLIHIARTHGRLGRNGIPNLSSSAVVVLNDWRDGRFHGWTIPPEDEEETTITTTTTTKGKDATSTKKDHKEVVSQWSKEFDLDSLFASVFN